MQTFSISASSSGIYCKLVVAETSQSIDNNSTSLSWKFYMWNTSDSWYSYSNKNVIQIKINDAYVYNKSDYGTISLQNGQTESDAVLMCSGSTSVTHNSDGSKNVALNFYAAQNWQSPPLYSWSSSKTVTLTSIARASTITSVTDSVEVNGTNQVTVKWSAASSSFYHRVKFSIGTYSSTTSAGAIAKTATSYSWTIPTTVLSQIPDANSGTMTVYLYTYSDSECSSSVGSYTSETFTITVPSTATPSNTLTTTMTNTKSIIDDWGIYVKGYCKATLDCSASAKYGASIKSYYFSGGGFTKTNTTSDTSSSYTTGVINTSGSVQFSCKVTDSRGKTTTKTSSVYTLLAYSKPAISSFTVTRNKSTTTHINVRIVYTFTSLNNNNAATVTLKYQQKGASTWNTYTGTLTNNTTTTITSLTFKDDSSYNFQLVVTDSLENSATASASCSTAEVFMDWGLNGKSLAIGKMTELDNFIDFGWSPIFRKACYMDNYSDNEKNFYFHNDAYRQGKTYETDGLYPHACKLYGGNGESTTAIGLYDTANTRAVWRYNDVTNKIDSDATLANTSLSITYDTTNTSAVTGNAKIIQFLGIAIMKARFTANEIAAATTTILGTIDSAYAPTTFASSLSVYVDSSAVTANCAAHITSAGEIKFHSTSAVAAGKYIYISGVWFY
ncbi:MAG: DUF859 family phage minor structural protein [Lachnospiraceae bacterium]